MIMWEFKQMNNLTFYLERSFEYVENGRMQTLEGAKKVDESYKNLLEKYNVEYTSIRSPYDINGIIDEVIKRIQ